VNGSDLTMNGSDGLESAGRATSSRSTRSERRLVPQRIRYTRATRGETPPIDFVAIYSWKSSSDELGFPSANRLLDG
jgi:hypothetical protein